MNRLLLLTVAAFFSITGLRSQNAYYDAKFLANKANRSSTGKIVLDDSVREVLKQYYPKGIPSTTVRKVIDSFFKLNPFFVYPADTSESIFLPVAIAGGAPIGYQSLLSKVGGLNVTNFADGLAKFLVKRFKEELSISFFQKFKEAIESSDELKTLFPEAYKVLMAMDKDIYRFNSYLNTLREAFIKDLINLYTNFKKFTKLPKYAQYFRDHPEINTLIRSALYFIDQYASGVHPGDVLERYDTSDLIFTNNVLEHNLRNSVSLIQAFSSSFKSVSTEHYWVPADSIKSVFEKNTIARDIYFGLMYQKHGSIKFDCSDGVFLRFDTLLARAKRAADNLSGSLDEYKDFIETFIDHAQEVNEYLTELKSKKKEDIDYNDYYKLYNASLDLFQYVFTFIDLPYVNLKLETEIEIRLQSNRWSFVAHSTGELYIDVRTRNYSSAILNLTGVADTLLMHYDADSRKKLIPAILKYGNFAAAIAQAENSDEVQDAIEAVALPVGSASIKRETNFNIAINAFVGLFAGREYLPKLKVEEDQWAFTAGVTAPVGVAFSWGNLGNGKRYDKPKNKGGKSFTVFVPVIDIGAMAAFRAGDDSSNVASEVSLENIISPGLYLYYGLGKWPLSIGIGGQLGPQLRKITATDVNMDKNYYFRFGLNVVVDIPLLNLSTKN